MMYARLYENLGKFVPATAVFVKSYSFYKFSSFQLIQL